MRDFVYTNKSIEECYGCKACEQICPKNAITMSENEELKDFYVESINFDENKEKIVTLPSGWIRIENIRYKAFLWDNFENISPECSEIEW